MPERPPDLVTSSEASAMLPKQLNGRPRRLEPYYRGGRLVPAMRAGTGVRSPLLFHRRDVLRLAAELEAEMAPVIAAVRSRAS